MTDKSELIPEYVLSNMGLQTSRQFKALKRKQLKAVKKAMCAYRQGCAYSPAYDLFNQAYDNITEAIEMQSAKKWRR